MHSDSCYRDGRDQWLLAYRENRLKRGTNDGFFLADERRRWIKRKDCDDIVGEYPPSPLAIHTQLTPGCILRGQNFRCSGPGRVVNCVRASFSKAVPPSFGAKLKSKLRTSFAREVRRTKRARGFPIQLYVPVWWFSAVCIRAQGKMGSV